jgi:hypothetical protein
MPILPQGDTDCSRNMSPEDFLPLPASPTFSFLFYNLQIRSESKQFLAFNDFLSNTLKSTLDAR